MIKFEFFVAGVPQAKQYQQTKAMISRFNPGQVIGGVIHNKVKTVEWEKAVGWAAKVAAGAGYQPMIGACSLWLDFYFPIPKSRKELKPGMPHLQDPDTTNLLKAAEDGLKRVLFVDDNLVWRTMCSKAWCEAGKEGVQVVVTIE